MRTCNKEAAPSNIMSHGLELAVTAIARCRSRRTCSLSGTKAARLGRGRHRQSISVGSEPAAQQLRIGFAHPASLQHREEENWPVSQIDHPVTRSEACEKHVRC